MINPNFETEVLQDSAAGSVPNAPTGKLRVFNRSGIITTKNDAGVETSIIAGAYEQGTYTPSTTIISGGGTASFDGAINFMRLGTAVTVWGLFLTDPVGGGGIFQRTVNVSLPPSALPDANFANLSELAGDGRGLGTNSGCQYVGYGIYALLGDKKAVFSMLDRVESPSAMEVSFWFSYTTVF